MRYTSRKGQAGTRRGACPSSTLPPPNHQITVWGTAASVLGLDTRGSGEVTELSAVRRPQNDQAGEQGDKGGVRVQAPGPRHGARGSGWGRAKPDQRQPGSPASSTPSAWRSLSGVTGPQGSLLSSPARTLAGAPGAMLSTRRDLSQHLPPSRGKVAPGRE